MVVRFDIAVVVAVLAAAVLWIEHGHRVDIGMPAGAALAAPAAPVCPENENVPYTADCIAFMQGGASNDGHVWANAQIKPAPVAHAPVLPDTSGPACPSNNENVPYSAKCLRFLSGWFWQPNVSGAALSGGAATDAAN